MKKYGGFIPGIRPGRPTAEYLDYVLTRITAPGALYLGVISLVPMVAFGAAGREPELPLRWHQHPDHGRCRVGHGEADREPTPAAQLRGLPAVVRIVLVGPPGAGKGTQAQFIASHLSIPKISTGDIFRANVSGNTPLGQKAKEYMDRGDLVPDEVTIAMVRDRLAEEDAQEGFLLDGFPRNVPQAETLKKILAEMDRRLDLVLELVVDDDEVVRRLVRPPYLPQVRPDLAPGLRPARQGGRLRRLRRRAVPARRRPRGDHQAPPGGLPGTDRTPGVVLRR